MTVSNDKYQVFLSHATVDKWVAKRMCEQIEGTGANYFRDDRDIDGGDDISDEIKSAISRSEDFVVLLTPQSLNRQWVLIEMGAAWSFDKRIVVILYQIDADLIPKTFARRKAIQLNDFDEYIAELSERIGETK